MSSLASTKDSAREAARERLLLRSPACRRRVKWRERDRLKIAESSPGQSEPLNSLPMSPMQASAGMGPAISPLPRPPLTRRRLDLRMVETPPRIAEDQRLPAQPAACDQQQGLRNVASAKGNLPEKVQKTNINVKGRRKKTMKTSGSTRDKQAEIFQGIGMIALPSNKCASHGRGRGGRQGRSKSIGMGRQIAKGASREMGAEDGVSIITPSDWKRPDLHMEPLQTPRSPQNVSVNFLFRMQDNRHGIHRMLPGSPEERNVEGVHSDTAINTFIDCKETPGSGCNSADRLKTIREGKRPVLQQMDLRSLAGDRDSTNWYNFCSDDGGCMHIANRQGALLPFEGAEEMIITSVKVPRSHLGLSPRVGSANMLLGEVLREFDHAVTGIRMYKLDFGGVLGVHAVAKDLCVVAAQENLLAASQAHNASQIEIEESTFTLDFPAYLAEVSDNSDGDGSDSDWEAEFVDWRGNSDSGNSDWALSDSGSEPEVVEESVFSQPDIEFNSLDFDDRYAPQHWEELSTTLLPNRIPFTGPAPGPVKRLCRRPVGVQEFFNPFWPLETLKEICAQTNKYARQPSYRNAGKTNGGPNWIDVSPREIRCWLGICIRMGLKKLPNNRMYWSHRNFFGCPLVKGSMRRARFEKITRNIHLVDNDTLVTEKSNVAYDKISKVRWLLNSFVQTSKKLYNCERHICVDEIMIPYRGRRCSIKQYMRNKPIKYGIKVWACANSKSRYIYDLQVYTGRQKGAKADKDLGLKVVKALVSDLKGLGHVVVTDRFFTSPKLFDELLREGFLATGTVLPKRQGMPPHLAAYGQVRGERGGLILQMHRSRQMSAIVWFDGIPVHLLSTSVDPIAHGTMCSRWTSGKGRREYHTSPILVEYQEMMRGVDVADQCRMEYTAQLRSHKWWHRLLLFVLDTSLGNAYVLYKAHAIGLGQKRIMSRAEFHYEVFNKLCDSEVQLGRTGASFSRSDCGLHYSARHVKLRCKCIVCGRKQIRYCPGCGGAYMCEGICFLKVHSLPNYAAKIVK